MDSVNIINVINTVLEKVYKSVEGKIYSVLDELYIISPDIIAKEPLNKLFNDDLNSGIVLIASSLILCYIIQYLIIYLTSMYNGNKPINIYKEAIKITICAVLMSNSFYICETVLNINYLFTKAIGSFGVEMVYEEICFQSFRDVIIDLNQYMSQDFVSLDGIIKGFISFGTITLLVNYAVRYVTVIFLVLVAPIMIMFASSNMTLGIFKAWLKTGIITLSVQWITQFLIIIPLCFNDKSTTIFKVIIVGTIYLLYRINNFSREILGTISEKNNLETRRLF